MGSDKRPLVSKVLRFIYTGMYSGYSPKAPGTAGTLVALLLAFIISVLAGSFYVPFFSICVLIMLYPSIRLGDYAENEIKTKDPQCVVFDEMMGYWIALLFLPFTVRIAILAFVLFRLFDILKPGPIGKVQNLKGGTGIMLDDYLAGLLSNLILWALILQERFTGVALIL